MRTKERGRKLQYTCPFFQTGAPRVPASFFFLPRTQRKRGLAPQRDPRCCCECFFGRIKKGRAAFLSVWTRVLATRNRPSSRWSRFVARRSMCAHRNSHARIMCSIKPLLLSYRCCFTDRLKRPSLFVFLFFFF